MATADTLAPPAPPMALPSLKDLVRPILQAQWLRIGVALGVRHAVAACLAAPLGCALIAVALIVVFIIVACVLEVSGPCWTREATTIERTRSETVTGADPIGTPSPDPAPRPRREIPGDPTWPRYDDGDDDSCQRAAKAAAGQIEAAGLDRGLKRKLRARHGPPVGQGPEGHFNDQAWAQIEQLIVQALLEGLVIENPSGGAHCEATFTFTIGTAGNGARTSMIVVYFDDDGYIPTAYPEASMPGY